MNLTQEQVKSLLHYEPETGVFTWRVKRSKTAVPGAVAGSITHGYWRVKISQRAWFAHRLAWLYMVGEMPEGEIDHIDNDPLNNRFANLRLATRAQNLANTRTPKRNTSGVKGVSWSALEKKWKAAIKSNGRHVCLGTFTDLSDAAEFRQLAADMLHGSFARHA